jgi:lysozyme family protein
MSSEDEKFAIAVKKTLAHEGGLSYNPSDPGGVTNFGISQAAHPEVDVRSLTVEQAVEIYRREYWNPLYGQIQDQRLINSLFDFGVTSDPRVAVGTLQRVLNRHKLVAGPILVDHSFGPATLGAVNSADPERLIRLYTAHRIAFYASLPMPQFFESWFERALDW